MVSPWLVSVAATLLLKMKIDEIIAFSFLIVTQHTLPFVVYFRISFGEESELVLSFFS